MSIPMNRGARRNTTMALESLEGRQLMDASSPAFITAAYSEVLHRSPLKVEVNYWNYQLSHGVSPQTFAANLVNSAEYHVNEIRVDYQHFLHRAPAPQETAAWLNAFNNGLRSTDAMQLFVNMPEYKALHAGNKAYVDAVYSDILGRPADAAGEAAWVNYLNSQNNSAVFTSLMIHSPEREGKFVDQQFATILNRSDTTAEHNFWVSNLTSGHISDEALLIGTLSSQESINDH